MARWVDIASGKRVDACRMKPNAAHSLLHIIYRIFSGFTRVCHEFNGHFRRIFLCAEKVKSCSQKIGHFAQSQRREDHRKAALKSRSAHRPPRRFSARSRIKTPPESPQLPRKNRPADSRQFLRETASRIPVDPARKPSDKPMCSFILA